MTSPADTILDRSIAVGLDAAAIGALVDTIVVFAGSGSERLEKMVC